MFTISTILDLTGTEISINHLLFRCNKVKYWGFVWNTILTVHHFMTTVRVIHQNFSISSVVPMPGKGKGRFKPLFYFGLRPTRYREQMFIRMLRIDDSSRLVDITRAQGHVQV